ncbi:glycoside hydrolase family 55 protein [Zasmidium cellare ATCC 36951]|uniref:Glycoside hydrolase family 55 protein n=1 Tax=Zasmidium cellare ATCC 36951 TaxID=1080233 RepID=A0A6A6C709_ZASCE|nr:glycoside hydrolase family 55 protein [Zasmidium cellare ATCC 36951]KAF2162825.1 glycoside hydrolase family 55 protein [Zasmidium cellare ATCC 36951]
MHFLLYASSLACAIGTSYAQIFVPAEVQQYVSYDGPSATASVKPKPTQKVNVAAAVDCSYWLESIKHQGLAAFNSNPGSYQVFRNVKDFGAKGDGVTDDTAAINSAISSGGRCAPGSCASTTTTPAIVYFPAGTYLVSSSIVSYYYTQIIGNPKCIPTIRAAPGFANAAGTIGVIDGVPYGSNGKLQLGGATNVFWRQIRNLIIDTSLVPVSSSISGVHWPTGQATSLQNIVFKMSNAANTQHVGIFIEEGSGGFMNDLVFTGGNIGLNVGNQQFTMRNLTFNGVSTAINQIWDWGWTYQNININNCSVGIDLTGGGASAQTVGSITLFDSSISNTPIGLKTVRDSNSQPDTAGSLILENIKLSNVPTAVQGANGPLLSGVSSISAWGQGHRYTPNGPNEWAGSITANTRPSNLLQGDGKYYQRSKPQYETLPLSSFLSARTLGAKGDGKTDDTSALQSAINQAKSQGKVLFVDHGDYLVTNTIYIPAGSKIVGEAFSVILSSGSYFNDMSNPKPVVQIGKSGEAGSIEWSDMIVSTKGQQKGAILFEYNLVSPAGTPSGLWDVHARIGGFAGSNLQNANCPKTPSTTITSSNLNQNCISGYMTMHITKSAAGLYLENLWLWVADHDVEDPALSQITIYAGRGLLDESANGPVWLVGTSVEHHVRYEYQFALAKNVFGGQIQTETAYYQPNPNAKIPFPVVTAIYDPTFTPPTVTDNNTAIPAANGWGLRIFNSSSILTYGVGLYSFFNNYSTDCSAQGNGVRCQSRILSVEGSSGVSVYNLNTVGTHWPITVDGTDVAKWQDNQDGFVQTIALFRK